MKIHKLTKTNKRKNILIFSFFLLIISIIITFKILDKTKITLSDKETVDKLLELSNFNKKTNSSKIKGALQKYLDQPDKLLLMDIPIIVQEKETKPVIEKEEETIIYIYNSHQTEEYAPSNFLEYSINPTVMVADYILEEVLNQNDYKSYVETTSIKSILNQNNWNYNYSYKASRSLLEQRKKEIPTLKYYIDIHRDSLSKDRTTVEIAGKMYAKTLFLIGTDNPKYQENLVFTNKLNDCLNEKYPTLSKGIYKKGGSGVNGVYNQDFSPHVVILEIGGYENNTTEVMNSTLAFSTCFMEVITENEASTNT